MVRELHVYTHHRGIYRNTMIIYAWVPTYVYRAGVLGKLKISEEEKIAQTPTGQELEPGMFELCMKWDPYTFAPQFSVYIRANFTSISRKSKFRFYIRSF